MLERFYFAGTLKMHPFSNKNKLEVFRNSLRMEIVFAYLLTLSTFQSQLMMQIFKGMEEERGRTEQH